MKDGEDEEMKSALSEGADTESGFDGKAHMINDQDNPYRSVMNDKRRRETDAYDRWCDSGTLQDGRANGLFEEWENTGKVFGEDVQNDPLGHVVRHIEDDWRAYDHETGLKKYGKYNDWVAEGVKFIGKMRGDYEDAYNGTKSFYRGVDTEELDKMVENNGMLTARNAEQRFCSFSSKLDVAKLYFARIGASNAAIIELPKNSNADLAYALNYSFASRNDSNVLTKPLQQKYSSEYEVPIKSDNPHRDMKIHFSVALNPTMHKILAKQYKTTRRVAVRHMITEEEIAREMEHLSHWMPESTPKDKLRNFAIEDLATRKGIDPKDALD